MIKKLEKESNITLLVIMIITFVVCLGLLIYIMTYLDQIYNFTESDNINKGELGTFGVFGTIIIYVLVVLLIISGSYIANRIVKYFYK